MDSIPVSTLDKYGFAPLHYAVILNDLKLFNDLLNTPSLDINQKDARGMDALAHAQQLDRQKFYSILINDPRIYCFEYNKKDERGLTPLHYAVLTRNKDLVKKMLSDPRTDLKITDSAGNTSKYYAQQYGYSEISDIFHSPPRPFKEKDIKKFFDLQYGGLRPIKKVSVKADSPFPTIHDFLKKEGFDMETEGGGIFTPGGIYYEMPSRF